MVPKFKVKARHLAALTAAGLLWEEEISADDRKEFGHFVQGSQGYVDF